MSQYLVTFDGSDRWLEDGKILDSAKFNAELALIKAAEDANEAFYGGTSNLTFKVGCGIRFDIADRGYNKAWAIDFPGSEDVYFFSMASTLPSGAARLVPSDTVWQTAKLTKGCQAFGRKNMLLQVITYGFDAVNAADNVKHPAVSGSEASQLVIREASTPTSVNGTVSVVEGQHPFSGGLTAADAADASTSYASFSATSTYRAAVAMRNLNNSFSFRVGSALASGTSAELTFKIMDAWD